MKVSTEWYGTPSGEKYPLDGFLILLYWVRNSVTYVFCVPSLSASVAVTVTDGRPVEATVIGRVPLVESASSAAASVTFWVTFQFAVVKVRLAPADTVMLVSPVPAVEVTVTLPVGWTARRTE